MSDAVNQIKDKLSIIDVITPYVELHKAGKNFKGKSPFSAEKTPSFYVSPDRGMYYCFSTSQGGDMFNFIQAMEGVDFKESLKILAEKAGVELVPEDPKKKTERERWYATLKEATEFYVSCLEKETEAKVYLEKRGVHKDTIQTWQIGYAPGPPDYGWREVKDALEKKGYTKDELLKVGLIKTTAGGKEPFDVFRDRIVFPLFDTSGKVVAFSGRILSKDADAPKYVNSPETELYKKSELLYGYDKAKHGIRQLDFSLIVEGQFDVVMSHQAGYSNAVAVSGTAMTIHHVQLLERLSQRVVLALDADRAGIAAMKRAADLMLHRGLDVKVAEIPEGKDPADLILEGKEKFKAVVGKSVHVIEFLLHVLKRTVTDERSLKLKAREEVLPFILLLPSRIDQEHFVQIVAKEIGSTTDAVRFELDRLREEQPVRNDTSNTTAEKNDVSAAIPVDIVLRSLTFLEGMAQIIDAKDEAILRTLLQEAIGEVSVEQPETKAIAAATFTLEQQLDKLPKLAMYEEMVTKLNYLRKSIIRRKLAIQKQLLNDPDEEKSLAAMKIISECEKELRKEPFTVSAFTGHED